MIRANRAKQRSKKLRINVTFFLYLQWRLDLSIRSGTEQGARALVQEAAANNLTGEVSTMDTSESEHNCHQFLMIFQGFSRLVGGFHPLEADPDVSPNYCFLMFEKAEPANR